MPPKLYIPIEKYDGDFRAMPAYIGQTDSCGVKWVNVHTGNRKLGMPAVMAVIILSDPSNGMPLAIIAGTYITNLRTGAAGAVAAKYLANSFSSSAGFVGCGSQALFQLMALLCIFKLKTVFAYDAEPDQLKRFVQRAKLLGVAVKISDDVPSCVAMKDIVVTTTPSRKPIIRADWISPGTHINAIGADAKGKSELDPAILTKSKVVVDDVAQAAHSGEINVPMADGLFKESDIYATLGQIVIGKRRGRTSKSEITVFDSTGLAIQDIAAATYIYRRAIASGGIRRKVSFL
jgi:alanine dehydrogenase